MKKINTPILITAFTLCALGLSAQSTVRSMKHMKQKQVKAVSPKRYFVNESANNTKRPMALTTASIQYPNTEAMIQTSYSLASGWNVEYINRWWTIQDTGTGTTENYDLNHSCTVAFDTIIDYNNSSNTAYSAAAGSVIIDTLIAPVLYKNTSGLNDTAEFIITNVLPSGYPGPTVLATYSVVLNQGVILPGNNLDTIYQIGVIPNFTLLSGTKFAVTLQFSGAKTDTLAFCYAFPTATCSSSGYPYADGFTYIGPAFGPTPACNSFVTGWEYYEYPTFAPVTWPNDSGNQKGDLSVYGGGPFDNDEWNLCGTDTEYFYWQDVGIFASISFSNVTGISNISSEGASVSQNFPNPFNKVTEIDYSLVKPSDIIFTVNDITGRQLVNNTYAGATPGKHQILLDAGQFKPGVYFYTFNVNGVKETKKMIIE